MMGNPSKYGGTVADEPLEQTLFWNDKVNYHKKDE